MSFSVPVMPLQVNIWRHGSDPTAVPPDVQTSGNLAWGKRVGNPSIGGTTQLGIPFMSMTLLLPALTDIRGDAFDINSDLVEVPAGSGRFYWCAFSDDLGKGFPNEHRGAIIVQKPPLPWPLP